MAVFDRGPKNTLIITLFATLIGIALGLLIAIVRATHDKTGKMKFLNGVCQVYLTVIRGTPVVIQLMISTTVFCIACICRRLCRCDRVWS